MSGCDWEKLVLSTLKGQKYEIKGDYRYNPNQYIFYSIVNTGVTMDQGSCAAAIARSFISLHNSVEDDAMKNEYLDKWNETGSKLIILKGCNESHLQYLRNELQYVAVAMHTLSHTYGRKHVPLVLTAFGRQDFLNKWLGGLPVLK